MKAGSALAFDEGPALELFVEARRRGVDLHPPQSRRFRARPRRSARRRPARTKSIRPTRASSSAAATRNVDPTCSARACPLPTCRPRTMRSGAAAARQPARGRAVERASAITSSAPALRSRATSAWRPPPDPRPWRTDRPPAPDRPRRRCRPARRRIVFSSEGATAGEPGKVHRQAAGDDLAMPRADVVLRQAGRERPQLAAASCPRNLARRLVGRFFLGARALGERQPAPVDQQRRARALGAPAPARRSGRRPPADRWCSRRAPAFRGPPPSRKASGARSPAPVGGPSAHPSWARRGVRRPIANPRPGDDRGQRQPDGKQEPRAIDTRFAWGTIAIRDERLAIPEERLGGRASLPRLTGREAGR